MRRVVVTEYVSLDGIFEEPAAVVVPVLSWIWCSRESHAVCMAVAEP